MHIPRLAVFKFASCDGCQLSLLALEDELLALAGKLDVAYFLEATSRIEPGPYDVALVEGSITTAEDAQRIRQVRRDAKFLVTIGACATAGGIQALRNWADSDEFLQAVYASPQYIDTLATSTAISDHVPVDFELRGCPINKHQLLEVLVSLLAGRRPRTPVHSVCLECKRRGTVCVMVAQGIPCLGPVTHDGCGADLPQLRSRLLRLFRTVRATKPAKPQRRVPVRSASRARRWFAACATASTATPPSSVPRATGWPPRRE